VTRPLFVGLVVMALAAPAAGQTADNLFDAAVVHDLQLFMNSRDLQLLRETYLADTYYQADVEWRGQRVRSIGVRSRGSGSRNPVKPGLKLDFNRYVSDQAFLGLKSLVLDNLFQDPSFLRESVTMALFTRMGQPAPREAYARLFINGVYEGLFVMVEPIDEVFMGRALGDDQGYLYEYQWIDAYRGEDLGPGLEPYVERFEAETREAEGQVALYTPIHDLFRAVAGPQNPGWRDAVERAVDVPQFLTHVAVEMFVSELDGLTGLWAMNNFYLHRRSGATSHQFLVWDRDNAFQAIDTSILLRSEQNILFQKLLAYDEWRAFYLDAVENCARLAAGGWLERRVAATAALIREAVYADTRKPAANDVFETDVAFLRRFARERPAVVIAEVDALRRAR
jgi:spore coat protein CotH